MKTLIRCHFQATMLSIASKRTFGVRRRAQGGGLELFEVVQEPGCSRVRVDASRGSAREMLAYLVARTDAERHRAPGREPDGSSLQSAFVLGPDDERWVLDVPHRELGESAIAHLPEDDPAAPCRSYVVAVDLPRESVLVAVLAEPAPTPAPTLAELERVALAVVLNTGGFAG
ncbi:MAG: hypothetical protein U0838_05725 [Chloroflexota bacterium]